MNAKRSYSAKFKAGIALEAIRAGADPAEIARENGLHLSLVYAWRQQLLSSLEKLFRVDEPSAKEKSPEVRRLSRKLERLLDEQEYLRRQVERIARRERAGLVERDNDALSISRQSRLLGLHRSMIYYNRDIS